MIATSPHDADEALRMSAIRKIVDKTGRRTRKGIAMGIYNGNVIPIGASGRERDPGQRILGECRDHLGKALAHWLGGIGEEIAEELFILADSSRDRLTQTRLLDLRCMVQKSWPELTAAIPHTLNRESGENPVSLEIADFAGLELVDDNQLSENIVIREFAARLAETCNDELYCLDRRVAQLLGENDVDKLDNPLGPQAICRGLSESCAVLAETAENRILLLRRIERHLHSAQPGIYREINQYLIDLGVLPDIKRSYRRSSTEPSLGQAGHVLPATLPTTSAPGSGSGESGILEILQRLVAARAGEIGTGQPISSLSSGSSPGLGHALPGLPPSIANRPNQTQQADTGALTNAFFASLEHFRPSEGNATINQIQLIRASEVARQVGPLEAVTIDIVAMLFDFIFNDKNIPNGVKALVGRLQIPVLKVAMLDQTFFANRSHPARRFLDEISGIALRWGGEIDQDDPFYQALAALIERIQNEFSGDVDIFAHALDELSGFVRANERSEESTTKIAADLAVRREREAEAWEKANTLVQETVQKPMPGIVADFFREQWVHVLQRIAGRQDEDPAAWQDAVRLMDDLAESVKAKKSSEERTALVRSLPALLSRVNRGLDMINGDRNLRRPFFDALVDLHTTALKSEAQAAAAPTPPARAPAEKPALKPPPAASVSTGEGDMIVTRSIANGVEVEEITLVGAKPAWRADDREVARQVAELKRGDWVEFEQEDGSASRERLTWTSPQRHLMVFSNHRAAKAISISPDALARKIREGQASIVSDESLFERAMSGVMGNLNAA